MKLRKKDRRALEVVLEKLERGRGYIMSDRVLVCIRTSARSTTLDFSNDIGETCCSVDKEIGSELALLHTGIGLLQKLLEAPNDANPEAVRT